MENKTLIFWALRADGERQTKAGRLAGAGWLGLTVNSFSKMDRAAIDAYLYTLRQPDYQLLNCVNFSDGDEVIGEFRQNQICIWFRKEDAYEGCWAVLRGLPRRSVEFVVPSLSKPLKALLEPLNHRVVKGSDAIMISSVSTPLIEAVAHSHGGRIDV